MIATSCEDGRDAVRVVDSVYAAAYAIGLGGTKAAITLGRTLDALARVFVGIVISWAVVLALFTGDILGTNTYRLVSTHPITTLAAMMTFATYRSAR